MKKEWTPERTARRYAPHLFARKLLPLLFLPPAWFLLPLFCVGLRSYKKSLIALTVLYLLSLILAVLGVVGMVTTPLGVPTGEYFSVCQVAGDAGSYANAAASYTKLTEQYGWGITLRDRAEQLFADLKEQDSQTYDEWKADYIVFYNSALDSGVKSYSVEQNGNNESYGKRGTLSVFYQTYELLPGYDLERFPLDGTYDQLGDVYHGMEQAFSSWQTCYDELTEAMTQIEQLYDGNVPTFAEAEAALLSAAQECDARMYRSKLSMTVSTVGISVGGMLCYGILIAAIAIFGSFARRKDKETLAVSAEVDAAEGAAARKAFEKQLIGLSKVHDVQGFVAAVNDGHARYEARLNVLLTRKEAEEATRKIVMAAAVLQGKEQAKAAQRQSVALYKARDFEQLRALHDDATAKLDDYRDNLIREQGEAAYTPEYDGQSTFDGTIWQRIGWTLLANFVTVLTLGIAYPAMLCCKQRWVCRHTVYNGKRLSFDGTGLQLMGKWICWGLLTAVTLGIYGLFVVKKLEQWKAKHTHIAGEYAQLGGTFDGSVAALLGYRLLGCFLTMITLGLALPVAWCMRERWLSRHRVYDGRRLSFDGTGTQLLGKFLLWWLLSLATLGIYGWLIPNRLLKWKAQHTSFAGEPEAVI